MSDWRPMTEPPPADIPHGVALVFAHFDTVQLTARPVDPFTWARDPANAMLDNAGAYAWTLLALPPNAVDEWMRECTPALKESA